MNNKEGILMDYTKIIDVIPDFPSKGISFKDISPLLRDPAAFHQSIEDLAALAKEFHPEVIVGPESRGFVFGAALAERMGLGFVMARKEGKLPGKNIKVSYALEYGSASLELREGSFKKGQRVLLVDDLIATGGSLEALVKLVKQAGGEPVGALVVIRLKELAGENSVSIPVRYLANLSASHAD
jgi:adenine phosphoribosyltransferase